MPTAESLRTAPIQPDPTPIALHKSLRQRADVGSATEAASEAKARGTFRARFRNPRLKMRFPWHRLAGARTTRSTRRRTLSTIWILPEHRSSAYVRQVTRCARVGCAWRTALCCAARTCSPRLARRGNTRSLSGASRRGTPWPPHRLPAPAWRGPPEAPWHALGPYRWRCRATAGLRRRPGPRGPTPA
jgi:hypothetical protein